jgi:hypothetical protein
MAAIARKYSKCSQPLVFSVVKIPRSRTHLLMWLLPRFECTYPLALQFYGAECAAYRRFFRMQSPQLPLGSLCAQISNACAFLSRVSPNGVLMSTFANSARRQKMITISQRLCALRNENTEYAWKWASWGKRLKLHKIKLLRAAFRQIFERVETNLSIFYSRFWKRENRESLLKRVC